jgi:glycosyltransferase involved in cell wall biosynthesis
MGKKILVLGLGQNNFLSFLYAALKKYDGDFSISVPFYNEITADSSHETWMYDNKNIHFKHTLISLSLSLLFCLSSKHFYQTFFFILFVEKKIGKSFHFCYRQLLAKSYFIRNNNFQDYDTFHFHFMQYSYLRELFLVPKGKKIVCTFWGSDLLRTNDILNFYFVKKALNRATVITCQSEELKEIILSKFGRNLTDKIQIAVFPVYEKIYDLMDLNYNKKEVVDLFKANFRYSNDKINILIGHSGSKANNHLKIIKSLENLSHKDKIHAIVNLNYAITANEKQGYRREFTDALKALGCSYVILEKFFVNDELAVSRLASDIFIHAPISDALSGTMLELLYASNIVVTGSWLPYKTYRKAKLDYFEIYDFAELSQKLDSIIENFESEKKIVTKNKSSIRNYFMTDSGIKNWSQILSHGQ